MGKWIVNELFMKGYEVWVGVWDVVKVKDVFFKNDYLELVSFL